MTKASLLAASSIFAMAAATSALAQDNQGSSNSVEQVVVTGSRITTAGYEAPTPVTVVDAAMLQRDAQTDIADSIRQLPAFGTSSGPNNSSSANFIVSSTPGSTCNWDSEAVRILMPPLEIGVKISSSLTGWEVEAACKPDRVTICF